VKVIATHPFVFVVGDNKHGLFITIIIIIITIIVSICTIIGVVDFPVEP
jgi:hypothetical protein